MILNNFKKTLKKRSKKIKKIISINLKKLWYFSYKHKFTHFAITGITGGIVNIISAWSCVNLFLIKNNYTIFNHNFQNTTIGIFFGISINLIYNFFMHTKNFKMKNKHKRRFLAFASYSLFLAYFITIPLSLMLRNCLENFTLLTNYAYLISTTIIISLFSIFSFSFFKLYLFRNS